MQPQITYTGRKLRSLYQTKDQTIFEAVNYKIIGTGYCKNTMKRKLS